MNKSHNISLLCYSQLVYFYFYFFQHHRISPNLHFFAFCVHPSRKNGSASLIHKELLDTRQSFFIRKHPCWFFIQNLNNMITKRAGPNRTYLIFFKEKALSKRAKTPFSTHCFWVCPPKATLGDLFLCSWFNCFSKFSRACRTAFFSL